MKDSHFTPSQNFEGSVASVFGNQAVRESTGTVLRYPGGKSRAVQTIRQYFPKNIRALCSPFLGGASIEISCAADGIEVYGSDAFSPVVNFWIYALSQPILLSQRVRVYHPLSRSKFYNLQKGFDNLPDDLEKAAVFFVLNRSSFSGTTLSGGMSSEHPRFTPSAIDRLRDFKSTRLFAECLDYKVALETHQSTFLYLDPPYANGGKLYGQRGDMHAGFSHEELADHLKKRDGWVLSYNDCALIRDLYSKYQIIKPEWTYGMSANKDSKELLIVNV